MKIVKIDNEDLITNLEASYYEHNSYLDMLKYIKENGYNNEYWDIWEQYMEVRSEYDTLKEHIRVEYVIPAVGDNYPGWWEIDFDKRQLFIYHN